MNERPSRTPLLAAGVLAAALDLWTKVLVFDGIPYRVARPVVPGWIDLYPTTNPAGPWSWGHGVSELLRFLLPALSVAAVVIILRFLWRTDPRDRVRCLGLALILGGAAGNLWDRAATALDPAYGGVRDFILVRRVWFGGDFPAFNLADTWITIGVVLVAWRILFEWRPAEAAAPPAADEVRA